MTGTGHDNDEPDVWKVLRELAHNGRSSDFIFLAQASGIEDVVSAWNTLVAEAGGERRKTRVRDH